MSYRVEVWDRENTERLAIFRRPISARRRRALRRDETLQLELPGDDPAAASISRASVLRVQREGTAADFTLWRVARYHRTRHRQGALTLHIDADALWMDARQGRLRQVQADGTTIFDFGLVGLTPAAWLADIILPAYDGTGITFAAGTVEPTEPLDLTFDRTSPLAALRMLEELTDGELAFRLNAAGTTYTVDLLERVGSATNPAELRYEKNLAGLDRVDDETVVATRLYGKGSGALNLGDARWEQTAPSGNTIGFSGPHPVFEDGAFVNLYWYVPGIGAFQITASDATAGTLTLASTTGLLAGDRGYIALDAAGTALTYLESPAARALYGIRIGDIDDATDIPDAENLVANADLAAWTAGLPNSWTALGAPAIAQSTDLVYAKHGKAAAHVTAAAADEGLLSAAFPIPQDTRRPYLGILANLTVLSGKVRLELRHSNGHTYPIAEQPGSQGLDTYLTLSAGPVHDETLPAGTGQLAVVAHRGAAEFYLDAAMATAQVGSDVPEFVETSGPWLLWNRVLEELEKRTTAQREYRVDVVDLYAADPQAFAFERLDLGNDVAVRDPDFTPETLRIVELEEDLLGASATRVVVAAGPNTRPADDLTPWLPRYREQRPSRWPHQHPPANQPFGSVTLSLQSATGEVQIGFAGNARALSFGYKLNKTGPETDPAGATIIDDPSGVVTVPAGTFELASGETAYVTGWFFGDPAGAGPPSRRVVASVTNTGPEAGNAVFVSGTRWSPAPGASFLSALFETAKDTRSVRVVFDYAADNGANATATSDYIYDFLDGTYVHEHELQAPPGNIHSWIAGEFLGPITLTPYTGTGGTGSAGTPKTVKPEPLSSTGAGVRAGHRGGTIRHSNALLFEETVFEVVADAGGQPLARVRTPSATQGLKPSIGGTGINLAMQPGMAPGDALVVNATLDGYEIGQPTAAPHTHAWADVSKVGSSLAHLATRSASDLSSGTLPEARLPVVPATKGGTGMSGYTAGDLLYAIDPTAITTLGIGSADQVLTVLGGFPRWVTKTMAPTHPGAAGYLWHTTGTSTSAWATVASLAVTGISTASGSGLTPHLNVKGHVDLAVVWGDAPAATTSAQGMMSAADKTKLNGIEAGAQANTVTSVHGRTGAVTAAAADYSGIYKPDFSVLPLGEGGTGRSSWTLDADSVVATSPDGSALIGTKGAENTYLSVVGGLLAWRSISTIPGQNLAANHFLQTNGSSGTKWSSWAIPNAIMPPQGFYTLKATNNANALALNWATITAADVEAVPSSWWNAGHDRIGPALGHGAIRINGVGLSNAAYSGINFTGVGRTFMVASTVQGVYEEATGIWNWYFESGVLKNATVPAASVTAGTFGGSGTYTFSGQLHIGSHTELRGGDLYLRQGGNNRIYAYDLLGNYRPLFFHAQSVTFDNAPVTFYTQDDAIILHARSTGVAGTAYIRFRDGASNNIGYFGIASSGNNDIYLSAGSSVFRVESVTYFSGFVEAAGVLRSTSPYGFVVGELANVQRIVYAADTATSFSFYTATNSRASLRAGEIYSYSWFRNTGNGAGLYNEANAYYWYADSTAGSGYWVSRSTAGIQLRGTDNVIKGYLYFGGSTFGLLDSGGAWRVEATTSGVNLSGTVTVSGATTFASTVTASQFHTGDWFRSTITGTGWYHQVHGGGIYMTDTTNVRVYNSKGFWCDSTIRGLDLRTQNNIWLDQQYGSAMVGVYSSVRLQGIWAMGSAYRQQLDGLGTNTLYGLAWGYQGNFGFPAGISHALGIFINGGIRCALGANIWTSGTLTGATGYSSGSSEKLKQDIEPFEGGALDLIRRTDLWYYRYIADPTELRVGFISERTDPLLAGVGRDIMKGETTIGIALAAIKEQDTEVDTLRRRVAELEERVAELEEAA